MHKSYFKTNKKIENNQPNSLNEYNFKEAIAAAAAAATTVVAAAAAVVVVVVVVVVVHLEVEIEVV